MRAKWAAVLGAAALTASCATSQFYQPEEDVVYRYGNFCGPGNPPRVSEDPDIQLNELLRYAPLDSLDAVCRLHDMCYEQRGRDDSACDYAVMGAMGYLAERVEGLGEASNAQCSNLAYEIMSPFASKYVMEDAAEIAATLYRLAAAIGGNDDAAAALQSDDDEINPGLEGLFSTMLLSARAGLAARDDGYPSAPGNCHGSAFPALEANFQCHLSFFVSKNAGAGDFTAVRASQLADNGCAELTDASFGR